MEQFVASTCDSLILTKRHPHTALSIILQVEKDDGAVSMLVSSYKSATGSSLGWKN